MKLFWCGDGGTNPPLRLALVVGSGGPPAEAAAAVAAAAALALARAASRSASISRLWVLNGYLTASENVCFGFSILGLVSERILKQGTD